MTVPRVLERITRVAPLGLRFVDDATGAPVAEGLTVSLAGARPGHEVRSFVTRAGVHVLVGLLGLREAEDGAGDAAYWATPPRTRRYRLDVADTAGRFLPMVLEVEAPHRGVLTDPCRRPVSPPSPPAAAGPLGIPLFSAPWRALPPGHAVVRLRIARQAGGRPAAHALVEVRTGPRRLGRGLADERGEVAVVFAWPSLPHAIGSPGAATRVPLADASWNVDVRAFHDPALDAGEPPELCRALAQPPADLLAPGSPPTPLGPQLLAFGRELVVQPVPGQPLLTAA